MAAGSSNEYDEKAGQHGARDDASPTLTHAPTVSDTAGDNEKDTNKEKNAPSIHTENPQYLNIPYNINMPQDPRRLSPSESSREHATRLVDDLTARDVSVKFLKEGQTYSLNSTPIAKLMLGLLGSVAEFERSIIRERQAEGIARAKASGVYKGRAKVLTDEQLAQAREWVGAGI